MKFAALGWGCAALLWCATPALGQVEDLPGRLGAYLATLAPLDEPLDAAFAADGSILVLEAGAGCVTRFDRQGRRLASFGAEAGLERPVSLAVGPDGRIAVADSLSTRIALFDAQGRWLKSFGQRGPGPADFRGVLSLASQGELLLVLDTERPALLRFDWNAKAQGQALELGGRAPRALAADAPDSSYIAFAGEHCIERYDASGALLAHWGGFGPHPGLLADPSDLVLAAGRVYVADRENHRIQVFDPQGAPLYDWGIHALRPREGEGRLHYPQSIAVDARGSLALVCEPLEDRAQLFGPAAGPAAQYSTDPTVRGQSVPAHYGMPLALDGRLLALLEPEAESAVLFELGGAEPLERTRIGGLGSKPGQFRGIAGAALVEADNTWAVVDRWGERVQLFRIAPRPAEPGYDPALASLMVSRSLPSQAGEARVRLVDIAAGPHGSWFALDQANGCVRVLDRKLLETGRLARWGTQAGELRAPTDLCWDSERERLWVVDAGNRRVQALRPSGELALALDFGGVPGGLVEPFALCLGPSGKLFLSDAGSDRILCFDSKGQFERAFGHSGLGAGEFHHPRGLGWDPSGRLFVVDHGNHRVQAFDGQGGFLFAFGARLFVQPTRSKR